jgi:uncharacterized membrane protein
MIQIFLKSPLPNSLAVAVLIALLFTWLTSIILAMRNAPLQTDSGWFAYLLPGFSLLGLPAAWDLLQAGGIVSFLGLIVLLFFLVNIILPTLKITKRSTHWLVVDWYKWSTLLACASGFVVAGYLAWIEATGGVVACGPSAGCASVQASRYATLFGFLSVGVLGLLGYSGILAGWVVSQYGPASLKRLAAIATWGMCFFGVLFSAYLTFLEPFVIGATCMWCISSAVLMIGLLLVSTPPAQQAFAIPDDGDDE